MYPSRTVEQALCESVLERLDTTKIDPLNILQLESRCNYIRSFSDFCLTLTRQEQTDPILDEIQRWQDVLNLSEADMQQVVEMPFPRLLLNIQNRNIDGIFEELDRVNAQLRERL